MLKLIRNGTVYGPKYLGQKDILIAADKIAYLDDQIALPSGLPGLEIIEAEGRLVVPGFIDSHVHIMGGGGEGGYKTRTPEILLSDITRGGITTVVGCLGTDGTTRKMASLLAKARALEEEGITTYIYTGSYQFPVRTLTGNVQDDLILIDKIIGVGELALSDHRSSQPTVEDIVKVAAEARVGGILSGKAGVLNMHLGDGRGEINQLEEIAENTEIPITQFMPTHMNRNKRLFSRSIDFARKGGLVDFTTSTTERFLSTGEVKCSRGLKILLNEGIPVEQITFSSDGQGSLPDFNEQGEFVGLKVGRVTSLYQEVKEAVLDDGVGLEDALQVITSNPARILKLEQKGVLMTGKDADLVLLDRNSLQIETVIARGRIMVREGRVEVRGTFEEEE